MSRMRERRVDLLQELGGHRNATRAEQLRATGLSDRAIARELGMPVEAVAGWFDLQDRLALSTVNGAA